MTIPPKPQQFDKDIGRLIPELEQTGPDETISVGLGGGSRDDLVPRYKQTMRDFLKSTQTDQLAGNKRDESTPFAEADVLEQHDRGRFFTLARDSKTTLDIKEIVDSILATDLTAEEILRAIRGLPNIPTPTSSETSRIGSESYQDSLSARNVLAATNAVLANNRFSPARHYMDGNQLTPEFAAVPKGMGTSESTETISFDQMRKIGLSLMLRATGEVVQGDPTSIGTSLGSLIPGRAQIGIPIAARDTYAQAAFGAPGGDRARLPNVLSGEPYPSFGQLNNMYEPFNGFLPIGMVALATILIIALRLLLGLFINVFFLKPRKKNDKVDTSFDDVRHPSTLTLASYRNRPGVSKSGKKMAPFITLADIGIIEIDRDWNLAVSEGLKVFFDIGRGFGAALRNVSQSPGFYANMVRVIIQSTTKLITSVIDAFKSLASNPIAGIQQLLGLIDVLKSSKIISLLNILAQLGDRALTEQDSPVAVTLESDKILAGSRSSNSNNDADGRGAAKLLKWRLTNAPALLLLPKGITTVKNVIKSKDQKVNNVSSGNRYQKLRHSLSHQFGKNEKDDKFKYSTKYDGESRFSPEFVKNMEKYLDSEYVPFYFHDLRTNEIVSFHAFIDDVSESFAPSYASSNPYGRVDPIMMYTNTQRTFSLSFKVVATDQDELSAMYIKLNKFTTLVYPQWTRGRKVQNEEGLQFIQPFSQVIGASPMIRIRLGDLIKTNFSNIALARLFGLGEEGLLGLEKNIYDKDIDNELARALKQIKDNGYQKDQIANYVGQMTMQKAYRIAGSQPGKLTKFLNQFQDPKRIGAEKIMEWAKTDGRVKIMEEAKLSDGDKRLYTVELNKSSGDYKFVASHAELTLAEDEIDKIKRKFVNTQNTPDVVSEINKFFDFEKSENNAIVRSFKNTKGKGLAGFITSLSMNWNTATSAGKWEVDRLGSKVPQICDIQLQFNVIHDIQPGLDSDGFNRAPVYNVWGSSPYFEGED